MIPSAKDLVLCRYHDSLVTSAAAWQQLEGYKSQWPGTVAGTGIFFVSLRSLSQPGHGLSCQETQHGAFHQHIVQSAVDDVGLIRPEGDIPLGHE